MLGHIPQGNLSRGCVSCVPWADPVLTFLRSCSYPPKVFVPLSLGAYQQVCPRVGSRCLFLEGILATSGGATCPFFHIQANG